MSQQLQNVQRPKSSMPAPEFSIQKVDGAFVEIMSTKEFIVSFIFVLFTLAAIPFLLYSLFTFYSVINSLNGGKIPTGDEKQYWNSLYDVSIFFAVVLCLCIAGFLYFYYKNRNKLGFDQDNVTISDLFKRLSRKVAQSAADTYSDEKVDMHLYDMSTLGDRINHASNNGIFYNDAREWAKTREGGNNDGPAAMTQASVEQRALEKRQNMQKIQAAREYDLEQARNEGKQFGYDRAKEEQAEEQFTKLAQQQQLIDVQNAFKAGRIAQAQAQAPAQAPATADLLGLDRDGVASGPPLQNVTNNGTSLI